MNALDATMAAYDQALRIISALSREAGDRIQGAEQREDRDELVIARAEHAAYRRAYEEVYAASRAAHEVQYRAWSQRLRSRSVAKGQRSPGT